MLLHYHAGAYKLASMEAGFENNPEFVLFSAIYAFPFLGSLLLHALITLLIQRAIASSICSRCRLLFFPRTLPTASLKLPALPLI